MEEKLKKAIIIIAFILISFAVLLLILYINKYGLSSNKLIEIITPYKDMSNILVYCGAVKYGEDGYEDSLEEKKQIRLVIEKLKKELGMIVSKFTSEEDSEEREALKTAFKNEEIQALVAIKCLDEGMNIPAKDFWCRRQFA